MPDDLTEVELEKLRFLRNQEDKKETHIMWLLQVAGNGKMEMEYYI